MGMKSVGMIFQYSRTRHSKMHNEYVDTNKEGLVLKKSRWPTICSGDKKNDIQFPNFDLENRYKTRVFTESEIEDLFMELPMLRRMVRIFLILIINL